MPTQFSTSIVHQQDSFLAGKEAALEAQKKLKGDMPAGLGILFCSSDYDYDALMRGIQTVIGEKVPLIGCTSAGQFTEKGVTKEGLSFALIASDTHQFFPGVGTNLKSHPVEAIQHATHSFPTDINHYPYQSAILLVDGLAGKGEEAVLAASSFLGPLVKFAGGAAGDDLSFKETFVFGMGQALTDAVSLCLIASRSPIIISVKHAHYPISGPLRITKAKGNVLYELEGRPALQVWKECLESHLKEQGIDVHSLNDLEMSKILLKYEAGLMTGSEYKIRFPASSNSDGSLNFVCTMLEGSVIKIMDSQDTDQIQAASQAIEEALKVTRGAKLAGAIIFDCACRAMILEDQFPKAVEAIQEALGELPFIGCETYGEIAMDMGQFSGFHNTTSVIMLFPS